MTETISAPTGATSQAAEPRCDLSSAASFSPLTNFAVIWATATLIHLLSFHFWARSWQGWLLVLTIGLVLMRPQSLGRFTAMAAASLANLGNSLPFVPNHILFEGMLNLTILLGIGCSIWIRRTEILRRCNHIDRSRMLLNIVLLSAYVTLLAVTKHEHLGGFTTALLLIHFARSERKNAPLPIDSTDTYRSFAVVLKWQLVVMYFWSVIQKLNADYFNPTVSCAVRLQREIEEMLWLPAFSDWFPQVIAWGSLVIEGGIPILLLYKSTRRAGFVLALVFHLWLAVHPHPGIYSFSTLVLAVLMVFLSIEEHAFLADIWKRQREFLIRKFPVAGRPHFLAAAVMTVFYVAGITSAVIYNIGGENRESFQIVNLIGLCIFLAWAIWIGFSYLKTLRQHPSTSASSSVCWTPAWIGLLLVIANGFGPWVGLKTQTSFSMFSNLRTEFEPNHFFLHKIDLFGYQQDMIEIVASTPDLLVPPERPTGIEKFANPGSIMPFFELRRLLSRVNGDVTATVIRNGETIVIERHGDQVTHAEAFEPPSFLERKFLWFRRHEHWRGPMPCTH